MGKYVYSYSRTSRSKYTVLRKLNTTVTMIFEFFKSSKIQEYPYIRVHHNFISVKTKPIKLIFIVFAHNRNMFGVDLTREWQPMALSVCRPMGKYPYTVTGITYNKHKI